MFPSALTWQNIYVLWKQKKYTKEEIYLDFHLTKRELWLVELGHVIKFILTCAVVTRAPNKTTCFCLWLFKGKSKYLTKHLQSNCFPRDHTWSIHCFPRDQSVSVQRHYDGAMLYFSMKSQSVAREETITAYYTVSQWICWHFEIAFSLKVCIQTIPRAYINNNAIGALKCEKRLRQW